MKLLIADDEAQILQGLSVGIDWKNIGITQVYPAKDGIEALELIIRHRPEIVITDIRMPGLDGLELAQKIYELDSEIKIIIISGYSEFDYAKQAMALGVMDYLLKPIQIDDLVNRVQSAITQINEQIQNRNQVNYLHHQSLLRGLERWIQDGGKDDQNLMYLRQYTGLSLDQRFACCLFVLDQQNESQNSKTLQYISTIIESHCHENTRIIPYTPSNGIFVVAELDALHGVQEFMSRMENCHRCLNPLLKNQFQVSVTLSESDTYATSQALSGFQQCLDLLSHRIYLGVGGVLRPNELRTGVQGYYSGFDENILAHYIVTDDYTKAIEFIKREFDLLKIQKITSHLFLCGICSLFINLLLRTLSTTGISTEEVTAKNVVLLQDVAHYRYIEEFYLWVETLYSLALQGPIKPFSKRGNLAVSNALLYLNQHYAEDIQIETVADHVNKSKNYFSALFKREVGMGFSEYLSKVRIDKAKKLLLETDYLLSKIAEMVGFSDYKYFSMVFKKLEGNSPSEYRVYGRAKDGRKEMR